jgi:hypothetical protein
MTNNFPSDPSSNADNNTVRDAQLEAVLSDHSGFIANRLQNFVGRQSELA